MSGDYKNTLNLPSTSFPMKANLPQREPEILKQWEETDLYQQLRTARHQAPTFVLHDGPPFANGAIHLGHATNKILKDIVLKSKTMSGFDTPYVPGWDCHGLPIELNVEKQRGKATDPDSITKFRAACRRYAQTQVDRQRTSFKRLGVLGDWNKPYLTMDYAYEANILRALAKIMENGHLEKGAKPVHWCIECESALAEAEVEYKEKTSLAIDVRFTVIDNEKLLKDFLVDPFSIKEIIFPIWTTTPWTLPANQAVAVHPHKEYVLIECQKPQHTFIVLLGALAENCLKRYGFTDFKIIATCLGQELEGTLLQHPFYDRKVPVILADYVTVDTGTGAVHTAPAHGQDDYIASQRYHLPMDNPVDAKGNFIKDLPLFGGENVRNADTHVIEILREKKALLHVEPIQHSYPHCWRHKTPLIFRATPQWFISLDKANLRKEALAQIDTVTWIPAWGKNRISEMISERPDWCISRQRNWFVPLALFLHKETGLPHPRSVELLEQVAQRIEKKGIEVWAQLKPEEFLGSEAKDYIKSTDSLDVWMDSGVSHFCVLKQREELSFPADLYLEGSDQFRGWFQSSLLTSCAMTGQAPYKQVLTHGLTIDAEGQKMSKSLGNVIAPEQIVEKLGADVLRFWVASTDYRGDIIVSNEILNHCSELYRRIRNTARFLLGNLSDFNPLEDLVPAEKMLSIDQWIVDHARRLQSEIQAAYESYQFHLVCQKLNRFCSVELSSFYLDILKDRLYTCQKEGLPRRSAQTALYHILSAFVRWIAPILSFTAEDIWQTFTPDKEDEEPSVFLSTWYTDWDTFTLRPDMDVQYWNTLMQVRDAVNKEIEGLRIQGSIGSALEAEVTLYADNTYYTLLNALGPELRFVLITSSAVLKKLEEAPQGLEEHSLKGLKVQVVTSKHPKCQRCWHRRDDIGKNTQYPDICGRCVDNISGAGEKRIYA